MNEKQAAKLLKLFGAFSASLKEIVESASMLAADARRRKRDIEAQEREIFADEPDGDSEVRT